VKGKRLKVKGFICYLKLCHSRNNQFFTRNLEH
jgi:hypothetical protein